MVCSMKNTLKISAKTTGKGPNFEIRPSCRHLVPKFSKNHSCLPVQVSGMSYAIYTASCLDLSPRLKDWPYIGIPITSLALSAPCSTQ